MRESYITLKEICDFQEGYVNPSQTHPEYFDGEIKWLRAVDLNDGFIFNTSRTITKVGFESAGKSAKLFEPGSIVISKSGTIGKLGILKDYMCGNRAVINIKAKDKTHTNILFVYYYLLMNRNEIVNLASGSVQKNLYVFVLEQVKIPDYSLTIQNKIVEILKSIDEKMLINEQINSNLKKLIFEEYNNMINSNDDSNFDEFTLDNFCNIFTGKKNANEAEVDGKYKFFTCSPGYAKINSYIYDGPAVLIAGNGAYTGRTTFYEGKFDLYQRTYACTIKDDVNPQYIYLFYSIIDGELKSKISGGTRGSAIPYIVMDDLAKFKIKYNKYEYDNLSAKANDIMKKIMSNEKENEMLLDLKNTILPKLINMEINLDNFDFYLDEEGD